jgi:hypothetical protein
MNVTIIQVGKDLKGKVADRSLSVEVSWKFLHILFEIMCIT